MRDENHAFCLTEAGLKNRKATTNGTRPFRRCCRNWA